MNASEKFVFCDQRERSWLAHKARKGQKARKAISSAAFTLVEILMVIALMLLLMTLAAPAISNLSRAGNMSYASGIIATTLEEARMAATAQKTYVWVGLASFPENNPDQLAVALYASLDGTPNNTSGNRRLLARIQVLNQIVLSNDPPEFGDRPTVNSDGSEIYRPILPYGSASWKIPEKGDLSFSSFLEFAPDGSVKSNGLLRRRTEFGIASAKESSTANVAVFQIEGLTAKYYVYRP